MNKLNDEKYKNPPAESLSCSLQLNKVVVSRFNLLRAHSPPPAPCIQMLQNVDQVGEDASDDSDLVRKLREAVGEQEFPLKLVAALGDQLLQLVDVVRRAEG